MKIYIDDEYKCHVAAADGLTEYDVPAFDGKCTEYIEGRRVVPSGATWTREDGVEFTGEMIAPWVDGATLDAAQREYEHKQLADYDAALTAIEAALEVST